MSMSKRTRANPKGLNRTISMASATKIGRGYLRNVGNGYVMDAPIAAPNQKQWGSDVKDWSGIHVTFTTDQAAYSKDESAYIQIRVWRYYNTHPMAVADSRLTGAWIQGEDRVIPMTGPAMSPQYSQHHVFDTRNAGKMYIQVTATHVAGEDPSAFADLVTWIQVQLWGYTRKDEPIGVEISTGGEGSTPTTTIVETLATHDLPVVARGPQIMEEAKTFDGDALPNAVAEGDAVRPAATDRGVRYNFLSNPDGSGTPIATEGATLTNAAADVIALLAAGRSLSILPTAVANLRAAILALDLYGRTILSSNQLASQSDRGAEINPLDTRDVPSILADGATVAAGVTVDFFVPLSHMKGFSLQWEPADGNFTLKVYATDEDNGTGLATCSYLDVTAAWFGAAAYTAACFLLFDTEMCAYGIHIEVVRAGGVGDSAHELFVRRNY